MQEWMIGDLFTVPLKDGRYCVGQVLDVSVPHTASCAFFDLRCETENPGADVQVQAKDIISTAIVVDAHLNRNAWKVFKCAQVVLEDRDWPYEATRKRDWVGADIYTGAILESFLNAFYGMEPWDKYHDPCFLDELLFSPEKKPRKLLYKNKA